MGVVELEELRRPLLHIDLKAKSYQARGHRKSAYACANDRDTVFSQSLPSIRCILSSTRRTRFRSAI
jgi:hypothetical protein